MKLNKYLIIIIFLSIALIVSLIFAIKTVISTKKTATLNFSSVVLENSYLFASPIQAKADNKEQIRITVYLLDGRGLGVSNLKVHLNVPSNINIKEIQPESDNSGKTIFDLSSSSAANIEVSAICNNQELPQKTKISFY